MDLTFEPKPGAVNLQYLSSKSEGMFWEVLQASAGLEPPAEKARIIRFPGHDDNVFTDEQLTAFGEENEPKNIDLLGALGLDGENPTPAQLALLGLAGVLHHMVNVFYTVDHYGIPSNEADHEIVRNVLGATSVKSVDARNALDTAADDATEWSIMYERSQQDITSLIQYIRELQAGTMREEPRAHFVQWGRLILQQMQAGSQNYT